MKLAKALKQKNKLGAKLRVLQSRIQQNNSWQEGANHPYDAAEVYSEYHKVQNELVKLKVAINKANLPITEKIIRMAELKSEVGIFSYITTTKGTYESGRGEDKRVIIQNATYDETTKDAMVEGIQEEIEKLQEEIDQFNAVTDVKL